MNVSVLFAFASAALAALFFLIIPFSRRHSIPKWAFALGMLALAVEQLFSGLTQLSSNPLEIGDYQQKRFIATALLPGFWLLFSATFSRGNAKQAVRKRLTIILSAFIIPLLIVLIEPRGLVLLAKDPARPFQWVLTLGWTGYLIHISLLVAMIGALVGLERTYRASVGTQRWKIKFTLYGLGTLFAARFYTSSQTVLSQQLDPALDIVNAVALLMACLLIGRSLMRPGSFEIDLYPSQSIISGSLTITLAGIYLIVVGVLAKLLSWFGGETAFALNTLLILVAVVGLGLLVQSDRFRQKLRRFVSRHFQRPLFDYRTVWLKVNEATSGNVRRKQICNSINRLVVELFDVKLASIWLLNTNNNRFLLAASSDLKSEKSIQEESAYFEAEESVAPLFEKADAFDLESVSDKWALPIKGNNPSSFKKGGHRVCVPLADRGHLVGFMLLGDRTNQLHFTQQEFDTLNCIADHLASSLLNAELTRKLAESKEIEAFQTMATFFVHDLKNAVSTLNLMLKNMPNHWDNPEFREDALRGLGNTSSRITQLITRLGNVRKELEINASRTGLQELIEATLEQWETPPGIEFEKLSSIDARLRVDSEKVQSVFLNLLINASEAMNETGRIELETSTDAGFATVRITDDGPGMTEEFIRNSLFQPFKTTKKNGLGIGMFQSKMVVEAHRGSLGVKSNPGNGTTFTVKLPVESVQ